MNMNRLLLVGVLAAVVCLTVLFIFFNYLKPAPTIETNVAEDLPAGRQEIPEGYFDLRGVAEVLVDIRDFDFTPRKIVVSPGTKVLWKNGDEVFHSVNFDSQPAGLLSPVPSSSQLKTGELYAQVLTFAGAYNYHSSDNPDTMTGIIVVK